MEEKHKIKVRADMFCKLFAASCGVKDGELFEISKTGNHLEFKVKIHHQENILRNSQQYEELNGINVELVGSDEKTDSWVLLVKIWDVDLVGCDGFKAVEIDEDTLKFIYLKFFNIMNIPDGKPENITLTDFESGDYVCSFMWLNFYNEILAVDNEALKFVGIEMMIGVAENNGVWVMLNEDENIYPFYEDQVEEFEKRGKYYYAEDDDVYGVHQEE